ncbi:isopenicillin N synthase family oxygenase [Kibdelosporangium aridum]|uniref:Isopenicillin N synthase family oxygenase n=1 Tax=Kibdelosporangium aridum TaxID=2030 RepID=A0A428Z2Q6_KIBAR|nr:2-oxoglutarate and iron-dependent oxygenase domain-containing protein [Kibdelosporangium aridum]RSM80014.1 isopenicillin N synthase family oxygenase [Kibdelosporangium aridum]
MADLRTFGLPDRVVGTDSDSTLAHQMIDTWQTDGIFQIACDDRQAAKVTEALRESRRFFASATDEKAKCVSPFSYAGYIASGEEVTAGEADYSEIFTVCQDVPPDDARVQANWPCHGPVPWPSEQYQRTMQAYMDEMGLIGEKLLRLIALGLDLSEIDTLTRLAEGGWHHMRVLRFPARNSLTARGIGAHTDYGMLVIAAQDDVGGLYIRPPVEGEKRNRNWLDSESSAGMYENEEPWTFVTPVADTLTVFPGDILQFLTDGVLLSTPHKVRLNDRERYTMAYFHEPNFDAGIRPLNGSDAFIHYGTHFTNMFMRCYPDRITTRAILEQDRLSVLARLAERASDYA